ncbi:hypothetical protein SAMN04488518_11297 [Pseudovibrio ascidiaceicola]|uniref:Uncharacterized protein n=1 Tax=Pseudovibrio ascidiaceicola TaxID=285279 RepID=A0A1I4DPB1_9HYPH|nr:hypothetical protein SAMN04488518_11297 [Pseudovibrio ascidiaceicola]
MTSPTATCKRPLHLATNYYNIPVEAIFDSTILIESKLKSALYGYIHN